MGKLKRLSVSPSVISANMGANIAACCSEGGGSTQEVAIVKVEPCPVNQEAAFVGQAMLDPNDRQTEMNHPNTHYGEFHNTLTFKKPDGAIKTIVFSQMPLEMDFHGSMPITVKRVKSNECTAFKSGVQKGWIITHVNGVEMAKSFDAAG